VAGNAALLALLGSCQPLVINNVYQHPVTATVIDLMRYRNVHSMLLLPITIQGKPVATLGIDFAEPHCFNVEDIALAQTVSEKLGQALETSRLYERLRRYAAELEDRVLARTRELAEANERLKDLDRLKSKFIADISHELRTPVSTLLLYVDLLERGKLEKRPAYLGVIRQEALQLATLVEGILDIARLEMTEDDLEFAPVDLNELVEQAMAAYEARAAINGLQLSFEPAPALPKVWGVPDRLLLLINNLIVNAINYTPHGGVRIFTCIAQDEVCLVVEDSGIGISEQDLPYVFDRFYRGQNVGQSNRPGNGLGLAIVQEVVDLHRGRITVNSTLTHGTTFRVCLPDQQGAGCQNLA
jgi:signal transduction histidine kinase